MEDPMKEAALAGLEAAVVEAVVEDVYPVLTFFGCSLCGRPFRIGAAHKDAVEAHHRKMMHPGDMSAVLEEEGEP